MLTGESLLLLVTDDESGRTKGASFLDLMLGGAMLLDLTLGGRVRITETGESSHRTNRVTVISTDPTDDALLDEMAGRLAGKSDRSPRRAVEILSKKVRRPLLERLVERGILRESKQQVLGLIPWSTWPTIDPEPERELRAGLFRVLVQRERPTVEQASVIALLSTMDQVHKVVAQDVSTVDKRAIKARAKELEKANWASRATRKAIQSAQAAAAG